MTGGTDWSPYAVPNLAGIMNEDLTASWEQVSAWTATADMITSTRWTLASARAELASAWPPETSDAAAHFFKVVDSVIGYMTETESATRTNAAGLTQVLNSMTSTREAIDQLYSTWHVYQQQIRETPISGPSSAGLSNNWDVGLNSQAHMHMAEMDQVVFDATRNLIVPKSLPQALSQVVRPSQETLTPTPTTGNGTSGPQQPIPVLTGQAPPGSKNSNVSGSTAGIRENHHPPSAPGNRVPQGDSSAPSDGWSHSVATKAPLAINFSPGVEGPGTRQSGQPNTPLSKQFQGRLDAPVASEPGYLGGLQESEGVDRTIPPTIGPPSSFAGGGMAIPAPMGGLGSATTRARGGNFRNVFWPISDGVPAILTAQPELEIHDPGPGVIGLDL